MFDMKALKTRYFELRLCNGLRLEVEPPKIKVLRKIMELAKVDSEGGDESGGDFDDSAISMLSEALSMALSKNRQSKTITTDWIEDNMNIDEIQELLMQYFTWVQDIQSSKN